MLSRQVQKSFLSPRVYRTVAAFFSGILIGILPDLVVAGGVVAIAIIGIVAILAWIFSFILPKQPIFDVNIKSPETIRSPQDESNYARQGIVCFVPLFTPQRGSKASAMLPKERLEAVKNLEFDRLDLEKSNLQPTIKAIVSHKSQLKHCWLLATTTTSDPKSGSFPYTEFLVKYLEQRQGVNCIFHYGENYTITLDDDALVLSKTYNLVQRIFHKEVPKELPNQKVIADITTGVRSMTLGMILACLDEDRDIEFIGTHYDENGKPDGPLVPTIFSFNPSMQSRQ